MFKIVAIQTLPIPEGKYVETVGMSADQKFTLALSKARHESVMKCLDENTIFWLVKGYSLVDGIMKRIGDVLPDNFYSGDKPCISVSAIVAENGMGKSSLLELLFRLVNNTSYALREGLEVQKSSLHFVRDIYARVWVEEDNKIYYIEQADNILRIHSQDSIDYDYEFDYENLQKNVLTSEEAKNSLRKLFYTIVVNYSQYAYNTNDYMMEWDKPTRDDDGAEYQCWLSSLFHKNDGYMCPIVLNPYRDGGQLDMNNEAGLTINRLASLLINDGDEGGLLENYRLDELVYRMDKDFYLTFEKGETEELDQGEMFEQIKVLYAMGNTYAYHILSNLGIEITDKTSRTELFACLYLVYKVLHIAGTYPSYNKYKKLGDVNNTFLTLKKKNEEDVVALAKMVKERHSHIEQKAQQTITFLNRIKELRDNNPNIDLDWMEQPFEYEGYRFFMEYEKRYDRIEELTRRLPPPIFKQEILLKKKVKETENGEDKWVKQIPFGRLSLGEKQLVYQLTTIVYHMLNIKSVSPDNIRYNDVNIVLDEIEVCFHPDYQRKFIKNLLEVLKRLKLNESFGIHLLMTTHSPFILSDIPSSQIMYLEEGERLQGNRLKGMPNPFAANVSEILHQSFFLDKGFMGEFARDRILSLARFLKGEPTSEDVEFWIDQDIEAFLEELSEPYIKNQLRLLYSTSLDEENTD